jgi:hypothetical protein
MLQKTPLMLRCYWVPSHSGTRAPLTAVWIRTERPNSIPEQDERSASADDHLWICAA